MNIPLSKTVAAGVLFLIIFFTGYWLHRYGRPINPILLNVHKLIGVATAVFLFLTVNRLHQAEPLAPAMLAFALAASLFFIATIVTGGLVSLKKSPPAIIAFLHHLLPYLTALTSGAALYLLR